MNSHFLYIKMFFFKLVHLTYCIFTSQLAIVRDLKLRWAFDWLALTMIPIPFQED
jgi:hypothetical protein